MSALCWPAELPMSFFQNGADLCCGESCHLKRQSIPFGVSHVDLSRMWDLCEFGIWYSRAEVVGR